MPEKIDMETAKMLETLVVNRAISKLSQRLSIAGDEYISSIPKDMLCNIKFGDHIFTVEQVMLIIRDTIIDKSSDAIGEQALLEFIEQVSDTKLATDTPGGSI